MFFKKKPKLNIGKIISNKYTFWGLLLLALAGFTRYFDRIDIRQVIPADSLINQIYNAGSQYISLKSLVIATTHITQKSIVYNLLFSLVIIILAISIFIIAKEKYSRRIAVASALIAGTGSYILLAVGNVDYSILSLIALPTLLLLCSWLHPKHGRLNYILIGLLLAGLLSVPYFWLMAIVALVFSRSRIKVLFKHIDRSKKIFLILPSVLSIILMSIYSYKKHDTQWIVGNLDKIPNNLSQFWSSIHEVIYRILVDFDLSTSEKLPLVSIALVIFSILSIYLYFQGFNSIQQKVLPSVTIIALLATISRVAELYYVIYASFAVMLINGIALLLQQWFTVFPKNPFARSIGVVSMLVLASFIIIIQVIGYIELTKLG